MVIKESTCNMSHMSQRDNHIEIGFVISVAKSQWEKCFVKHE